MSAPLTDSLHALRFLDPERVGVCVGERGAITDANESFLRLTGYTREDLEDGALDVRAITPPEWADADEAALLFLRRHGYTRPYLKQILRRDGTRIDIIVTGTLTSEEPRRWLCCVVDVTTLARDLGEAASRAMGLRPRASTDEAALPMLVMEKPPANPVAAAPTSAVQRALLADVLDAAPQGALVLGPDAHALHATPRSCAMLGLGPAHWLGDRWRDLVHPEDRAVLDMHLLALLGRTRRGPAPSLLVRWRHARGHWAALEVRPALVPDPADCAVVLHLHDPEPSRAAENAPRVAALLRGVLTEAWPGQATLLLTPALDLISADGDLLTRLDAHPADLVTRWRDALENAARGYESRWVESDAEGHALDCRTLPLRAPDGTLTQVLVVLRDPAVLR